MIAVSPDLLLMLLSDARLPVAGHAQSAGLEPGVQAGLSAAEVPRYIAARLETTVRVEAGTAVVAPHHLVHGLPLEPVVAAWAARTPSPAMRRTSRSQARAFLRLSVRLWPDVPAVASAVAHPQLPRPVALAAAATAAGLRSLSLAHLVGYDDAQTVASAALKLLPLDPVVATGWVRDALSAVSAMARDLAWINDPIDIPAAAAPQTELWAERHARTTRRLFSA